MKVQILGRGCAKCRQLAAQVEVAAAAMGLDYELEKITDINRISDMGVTGTPALAVDGQIKCMGRVPGVEELKTLLG